MGDILRTLPDPTDRAAAQSPPDALWRMVLGSYLRGVRAGQGRILTDIAAEAGVSPQYLSEIERGRKEPSSEILSAVSGALGITLLDITRGVAQMLERAARPAVTIGGVHRRPRQPTSAPATGRPQLRMVS